MSWKANPCFKLDSKYLERWIGSGFASDDEEDVRSNLRKKFFH